MTSSASPERRRDSLTGREVIVAANRSARPIYVGSSLMPQTDADDPFLEGNEYDTPSESLALRRADSRPNQPGWLLRVVPNRYPAVTQEPSSDAVEPPVSMADRPAHGVHEVVIECPDGRTHLADFSVIEVVRMLTAWQLRYNALAELPGIKTVNIFRNEGAMAGASLPHCHSQIIASDFGNRGAELRADVAEKLKDYTRSTPYKQWLDRELGDGDRIVSADESLAICCPFASRVAWHVRLCPRDASEASTAGFGILDRVQRVQLATRLLSVVKALRRIHGDVAFNLLLSLPPTNRSTQFPWMLDLMPRTSQFAGFELLTDIDIITTAPEEAATCLREAVQWLTPPNDTDLLWPQDYEWKEG